MRNPDLEGLPGFLACWRRRCALSWEAVCAYFRAYNVTVLAVERRVVEAGAAVEQAHDAGDGAYQKGAQPQVAGLFVEEGERVGQLGS